MENHIPVSMSPLIRILLSLILAFPVYASSFSQKIMNVDFVTENNRVIVSYDFMKCNQKRKYDIMLRFMSEDKKIIYPRSVSGDLYKIGCGTGKKISWDVLRDVDDFSGRMVAVLSVSNSYKTRTPGGPGNAFLSLLIPGLGDKYVAPGKKRWYWTTITVYGLIGAGVGCKFLSDSQYDKYHKAQDQSSMDRYYNNANFYNKAFYTLAATGALVWLIDIIHVASKGSKNKKRADTGFNYDMKSKGATFSYRFSL